MITIENIGVFGWEAAIRGMRNPMNSWDKSDSFEFPPDEHGSPWIGPNDLKLMQSLICAGTDHSKFMRMINVTMDITAPFYYWKEFSTYKIGTVANSCSTMHKIHAKEFTLDDFSCEHLLEKEEDMLWCAQNILDEVIMGLNHYRDKYLFTKDKKYWWQMIQLLPSSYNQKRTIQLNYQVLRNIYFARRNHKLDEWIDFCKIIEQLPYGKELICLEN